MKFRVAATRLRVGTLGIYWDSRALTECASNATSVGVGLPSARASRHWPASTGRSPPYALMERASSCNNFQDGSRTGRVVHRDEITGRELRPVLVMRRVEPTQILLQAQSPKELEAQLCVRTGRVVCADADTVESESR